MKRLGFIGLVVVGLVFSNLGYAQIDLKEAAVGVWLFDEGRGDKAKDSSPNGNDGILKEGPEWVKGKFGYALRFDGKDDYVQIPPSSLFNSEKFTVVFWMFPETIGGNNPPGSGSSTLVVTNGNPGDGGGGNWWFELWNNGNFEFKSCKPDCSAAKTSINVPNKWYFIAGSFEGGTYKLYVDGKFVSSGPNDVRPEERGLLIGSGLCPVGHGCDKGYFKGIIDDVGIFNEVLEEGDLKKIMEKGLGSVLGIVAVDPSGNLPIIWGDIKTASVTP
ncbi:LamG domain-containing protein [Candidatus Poribacteria bacterium]|nr:LamG domain-containing protein [Candidatus Poribacteria bacterium]